MSVADCLQRTQKLLATSWLSPREHWVDFARADADGKPGTWCDHDDEGVAFFSLHGALTVCASGDAVRIAARELLEQLASPAFAADEEFWRSLPPGAPADEAWWKENRAHLRLAVQLACAAQTEGVGGLDEWLKSANLVGLLRLFDLAIACAPEAA